MPGRHLSLEQRGLMGMLRSQGVGLREVARQVGCHHSTLDKLLIRQGGHQVLNGSALALAATVSAIARTSNAPTGDTVRTLIR